MVNGGKKEGFSQATRLRSRKDYEGVYSRGQKINTRHFVLFVAGNPLVHHRLGLTVSRKIGKSVVRNQIKRRLREIFRLNKETLPTPCDLVINVKRSSATAPFTELERCFQEAAARWRGEYGKGRPVGPD